MRVRFHGPAPPLDSWPLSPRIGKKLAQLNNCGYACANLLFVAWAGSVLLPELLHKESWSASLPQRGQVDMIFGVYFYSKAWEVPGHHLCVLDGHSAKSPFHCAPHHHAVPGVASVDLQVGGFPKI